MTFLSLVKLLHLWGLVMGLGGAVLADLTILRFAVLKPVRRPILLRVARLSRAVMAGLAVLWISGLMLVALRSQADPGFLDNPKLWSKIAIVVVLTVNGLAIHRFALPRLMRSCGRRLFDGASQSETAALTLIAALSSVSWFVPYVLGTAAELNFTTPASVLLSAYAALVFSAWIVMFAAVQALSHREAQRSEVQFVPAPDIYRRLRLPRPADAM